MFDFSSKAQSQGTAVSTNKHSQLSLHMPNLATILTQPPLPLSPPPQQPPPPTTPPTTHPLQTFTPHSTTMSSTMPLLTEQPLATTPPVSVSTMPLTSQSSQTAKLARKPPRNGSHRNTGSTGASIQNAERSQNVAVSAAVSGKKRKRATMTTASTITSTAVQTAELGYFDFDSSSKKSIKRRNRGKIDCESNASEKGGQPLQIQSRLHQKQSLSLLASDVSSRNNAHQQMQQQHHQQQFSLQRRSFHQFGQMINMYNLMNQDEREATTARLGSTLTTAEYRMCGGVNANRRRVREVFHMLCYGINVNPDRMRMSVLEYLHRLNITTITQLAQLTEKNMLRYIDCWYAYASDETCDWDRITAEEIELSDCGVTASVAGVILGQACRSCVAHFLRFNHFGRLCPKLCINGYTIDSTNVASTSRGSSDMPLFEGGKRPKISSTNSNKSSNKSTKSNKSNKSNRADNGVTTQRNSPSATSRDDNRDREETVQRKTTITDDTRPQRERPQHMMNEQQYDAETILPPKEERSRPSAAVDTILAMELDNHGDVKPSSSSTSLTSFTPVTNVNRGIGTGGKDIRQIAKGSNASIPDADFVATMSSGTDEDSTITDDDSDDDPFDKHDRDEAHVTQPPLMSRDPRLV